MLLIPGAFSRGEEAYPGAYLTPQTLFVGDRGRLVTPLGKAFSSAWPFIWENKLPEGKDIQFQRIELEQRNGETRLIIDFIPYAPGIIPLPPLAVPSSGGEPLLIRGLSVQVASILDPSSLAISPQEPPLALPGTSLFLYGTVTGILALLFLALWVRFWGRHSLKGLWETLHRRRLLRGMERFLRRLDNRLSRDPPLPWDEALSRLSSEFRAFLSSWFRRDCLALTPREFLILPGELSALGPLFKRWDVFRFSGKALKRDDMEHCIADVRKFLEKLSQEERTNHPGPGGQQGILKLTSNSV